MIDPIESSFEDERPRLLRIAEQVLADRAEAEDVVQNAWLRWQRAISGSDAASIDNLPGWLTTVTTRLCLDRLRARVPEPSADDPLDEIVADPADDVAMADTVGAALNVVLDALSPAERVAFVLHDSFGVEFDTIAAILDRSPSAARKLASRARARISQPSSEGRADAVVVDAFMAAARNGEFARLLELLAPGVIVDADAAAIAIGTPARMEGRDEVAEFFNGAAAAALPVEVGGKPGSAWFNRGRAMVLFDFTVDEGQVSHLRFRAEQEVLEQVTRR